MPKLLKDISLYFIPIALFSYAVHSYIFSSFFSDKEVHYSIDKLYMIIFMITLVNILVIAQISKTWNDKTGFAFMISGIVKMFLIIFLIAKLRFFGEAKIYTDGINITIVYLLSLIPEAIISVKLLDDN